MGASRLRALMRERAQARRKAALAAAARVLDELASAGVAAVVAGSLAKGPFLAHSDVDFVVVGQPDRARRRRAEEIVARNMAAAGLPYDLVFADFLADRPRTALLEGHLDASRLRALATAA